MQDRKHLTAAEVDKLMAATKGSRNARLERFTLDRMIAILGKLDEDVEVTVTFRPRSHAVQEGLHAR